MKKLFSLIMILMLLICSAAGAEGIDFSSWTDDQLRSAYQAICAEADARGIALTKAITLSAGRYIVGQDIEPGTYMITCTGTEMDAISESYGHLGSAMDGLTGGGSSYSDIYSSLGSAFASLDEGVTIEVVGDYGIVIKSVQLKKGESVFLTLEGKVALNITEGSCRLEIR